jgi:hypothetical protein
VCALGSTFRLGRAELLQILLDDLSGPRVRAVGILAEFFARTALTQQVPEPVELHVDVVEPPSVVGRQRAPALEQRMLLGDEGLDMGVEFLVVHRLSIPARWVPYAWCAANRNVAVDRRVGRESKTSGSAMSDDAAHSDIPKA